MPFDPALPANNSPVSSSELRAQLTSLNDAINTGLANVNATIVDQITNNTAANISSFPAPSLTISDPPTQAEVQQIADILHDLVIALQTRP